MSLKKYSNTNKAEVDEPSVWKISNGSIQVERAGGTELISFEDEFTILFGDVSAYSPVNPDPVEPVIPEPTPTPDPVDPTPDPSGGGDDPSGGEDEPTPTPSGNNQITVIIRNDTNQTVRFTGFLRLYINEYSTGGTRDFCFRNNRTYYYPANDTYGDPDTLYVYKDGSIMSEGHKHGANTEKLDPNDSITIIYKQMLENSTSRNVYIKENLASYFGKHFRLTSNKTDDYIKLSIAVDRSSDLSNRVDEFPTYFAMRFVDSNGNRLSTNPEIKANGTYYISIYDFNGLYSNNWVYRPYMQVTEADKVSPDYVTVS